MSSEITQTKKYDEDKIENFRRHVSLFFYFTLFLLPLSPIFIVHIIARSALEKLVSLLINLQDRLSLNPESRIVDQGTEHCHEIDQNPEGCQAAQHPNWYKIHKRKILKILSNCVSGTLLAVAFLLSGILLAISFLLYTITNIFTTINPENGSVVLNILKIAAFYLLLPISFPIFVFVGIVNDLVYGFNFNRLQKMLNTFFPDYCKHSNLEIDQSFEYNRLSSGAYYLSPKKFDDNKKTLIILHGNGQSFDDASESLSNETIKNCNLVVLGYPGYNDNFSIPSVERSVKCLDLVIKDLKRIYNIEPERDVVLFGYSLGGQVALRYLKNSKNTKIAKTILVAPFDWKTYFVKENFISNFSSKILGRIITFLQKENNSISNNTGEIIFYKTTHDEVIAPLSQQRTFDSLDKKSSTNQLTKVKLEYLDCDHCVSELDISKYL